MIVKYHDHEGPGTQGPDPWEHDHRDTGGYHGGCVSPWSEGQPEPSRPIGFRFEPREQEPSRLRIRAGCCSKVTPPRSAQ